MSVLVASDEVIIQVVSVGEELQDVEDAPPVEALVEEEVEDVALLLGSSGFPHPLPEITR
ncbi:MAG: hypothetical protein IPK80_03690 [Nannocystis sp.]|nr:hypothetical protein [Nannocystis sp.]